VREYKEWRRTSPLPSRVGGQTWLGHEQSDKNCVPSFAESGAGGKFDLDQERRKAADRVVVRKVLEALEQVRS
jgi:hypothetical protein